MKKIIVFALCLGLGILAGNVAFAGDPLTDYRLGEFALNLNYIYGSERSGFTVDKSKEQLTEFASKSGGALEYVGTVGIGHNFALQYRNWGVNTSFSAPQGYSGTLNTDFMNQQVSLLYRVGPKLWYDLASDVSSVFTGKPSEHDEVAHTRDIFALVVGWDNIQSSQSGNVTGNGGLSTMVNPPSVNRSSVVVGYEMCYQIFPKFYNSIRATYSFNNAFYGEMGYSYEIFDKVILGGQIATKDVFNNGGVQADNFYMTGLMVGLTYQY